MSQQNSKLTKGILFKEPHQNAPDFIIGKLSIKNDEFIQYLNSVRDGEWTNLEVKLSRDGKPYIELDDWKPSGGNQSQGGSRQNTSSSRQNNDDFSDPGF